MTETTPTAVPPPTGNRSALVPNAALRAEAELIATLVGRDLKARYKQSILGISWAILSPMAMAFIYTLVGYYFLRQRTGPIPFPIYAYTGLLFWNLFSGGISAATESLVNNISLITKVYFPREVFPISSVLSKVTDFGFGLVGLLPLLIYFRILPGPGTLLIVPLFLILLLLTTGIGMLTACANLYYRDVRHVVGIALSLLIYVVPNFYTLNQVPEGLRPFYLLNPVATVIEGSRRLAFPALGPPLEMQYILIALGISLICAFVGYSVFKRSEEQFAEFV